MFSLSFVGLHLFFDLLFYGVEVERGRRLHRRIVDGSLRKFEDRLLDDDRVP
jgi:hypothetical protein